MIRMVVMMMMIMSVISIAASVSDQSHYSDELKGKAEGNTIIVSDVEKPSLSFSNAAESCSEAGFSSI